MGDGVLVIWFPRAFEDAQNAASRRDRHPGRSRRHRVTGQYAVQADRDATVSSWSANHRTGTAKSAPSSVKLQSRGRLQALAEPDTILVSEATQNCWVGC